jgi:hypothetical protein
MNNKHTFGSNIEPPVIDLDLIEEIYDLLPEDAFSVEVYNSLLIVAEAYMEEHHDTVEGYLELPFAEVRVEH